MKQINLANLDVVVICDKSGSMDGDTDTPSGQTRWAYARESILHLMKELGKFDDDGIDLIFFNASHSVEKNVNPDRFQAIWDAQTPGGGTVLTPPLQAAMKLCEARWGEKNQLILVLTDGQPNDPKNVGPAIIDTTTRMARDEQMAILFLQVGHDTGAKAFLTQLDDGLQSAGAKFDIVDSDSLEAVSGKPVQDVVNKAFND